VICVSLAEKDVNSFLKAISYYKKRADLIEIRLDALVSPDFLVLKSLVKEASDTQFIVTNRASWEGGNFKGSEDERIELLCASIELGANFVDVEINTNPSLRDKVLKVLKDSNSNTKLIFSFHDFSLTPPIEKLRQILLWQRQVGAHIGKIVTIANSKRDCAYIMSLYALAYQIDFKLLSFCMGERGMFTRIASLAVGAPWMYVSSSIEKATAPGQLTFDQAERVLKIFPN